jgi:(p)ppGpp synthase/HD superfamily hydrolase
MNKIERALEYAARIHKTQTRKGTKIPYIVHIWDVASILLKEGARQDVVVAGMLHDVIEDHKVNPEEIEELFGEDVRNMVLALTEDKSEKDWEIRKLDSVQKLYGAPVDVQMIKCADATANMRDIYWDCKKQGEKVWKRFNAGKIKQQVYNTGLLDALQFHMHKKRMYKELEFYVKETFKIPQGENFFSRECRRWYPDSKRKSEVWCSPDDGGDSYETCPKGHQIFG